MRRALIAGPCVSELGWELMAWQGHVRHLAEKYDRVVVCSTAGLDSIYSDCAHAFIGHFIRGVRDCHSMKHIENLDEARRVEGWLTDEVKKLASLGYSAERIAPSRWSLYADEQRYIRYGSGAAAYDRGHDYDVVIHARSRANKTEFTGTNYDPARWAVVAQTLVSKGYRVCCIGSIDQSELVAPADDRRGIPFEQLQDLVAGSGVVVGPSSGPMHLASLCGTAHVVWSHTEVSPSLGCTNEERYKTVWNPFETPVTFIPELQPAAEDVVRAVEERLNA